MTDPKLHEWHYRGLANALSKLNDTEAYQEFLYLLDNTFGKKYGEFHVTKEDDRIYIYGALDDKYSKTHPNFAWKFTLSYFYIGFIIILFLCYFKYHEEIIEDSSEVNLEDQVVEIAAIGSGTDANDHFSLQAPVPKRAKSTVKKKSELIAIFKDDNIDEENSQNLSFN